MQNPPAVASPEPQTRRNTIQCLLLGVAVAASLARDAYGQPALPVWLAAALQLPAFLLACGTDLRHARSPTGRRPIDPILDALVLLGAALIALTRHSLDAALTATTVYLTGRTLLDAGVRLFRDASAKIDHPPALLARVIRTILLAALISTALLCVPIATQPGIPDYRHNFWLFVSNNAFAAASAASLSGVTIYSFAEDYSFFGQVVLFALTQLAGFAFAAVGLSIIRPFLHRNVRLINILRWAAVLQILGILTMAAQWAPVDTPTMGARIWWSAIHAADGLWNTGLITRSDGLARYLLAGPIYGVVTMLAIAGSLGLPIVFELLLGPGESIQPDAADAPRRPWKALPAWDAGAAFWLLLFGAILLTVFETPGALPDAWVPSRPFEFGSQQIALRDDMGIGGRASMSIHVSAILRSAGIQSFALSAGSISWPTYGLMLIYMMLGGTIAGTAGGLRISTLMLWVICLWAGHWRSADRPDLMSLRSRLKGSLLKFACGWVALNIVTGLALAALTDGTAREIAFDTVATLNNVGFTTGLVLHLSTPGRLLLISVLLAGRVLPLLFWTRLSKSLSATDAVK